MMLSSGTWERSHLDPLAALSKYSSFRNSCFFREQFEGAVSPSSHSKFQLKGGGTSFYVDVEDSFMVPRWILALSRTIAHYRALSRKPVRDLGLDRTQVS